MHNHHFTPITPTPPLHQPSDLPPTQPIRSFNESRQRFAQRSEKWRKAKKSWEARMEWKHPPSLPLSSRNIALSRCIASVRRQHELEHDREYVMLRRRKRGMDDPGFDEGMFDLHDFGPPTVRRRTALFGQKPWPDDGYIRWFESQSIQPKVQVQSQSLVLRAAHIPPLPGSRSSGAGSYHPKQHHPPTRPVRSFTESRQRFAQRMDQWRKSTKKLLESHQDWNCPHSRPASSRNAAMSRFIDSVQRHLELLDDGEFAELGERRRRPRVDEPIIVGGILDLHEFGPPTVRRRTVLRSWVHDEYTRWFDRRSCQQQIEVNIAPPIHQGDTPSRQSVATYDLIDDMPELTLPPPMISFDDAETFNSVAEESRIASVDASPYVQPADYLDDQASAATSEVGDEESMVVMEEIEPSACPTTAFTTMPEEDAPLDLSTDSVFEVETILTYNSDDDSQDFAAFSPLPSLCDVPAALPMDEDDATPESSIDSTPEVANVPLFLPEDDDEDMEILSPGPSLHDISDSLTLGEGSSLAVPYNHGEHCLPMSDTVSPITPVIHLDHSIDFGCPPPQILPDLIIDPNPLDDDSDDLLASMDRGMFGPSGENVEMGNSSDIEVHPSSSSTEVADQGESTCSSVDDSSFGVPNLLADNSGQDTRDDPTLDPLASIYDVMSGLTLRDDSPDKSTDFVLKGKQLDQGSDDSIMFNPLHNSTQVLEESLGDSFGPPSLLLEPNPVPSIATLPTPVIHDPVSNTGFLDGIENLFASMAMGSASEATSPPSEQQVEALDTTSLGEVNGSTDISVADIADDEVIPSANSSTGSFTITFVRSASDSSPPSGNMRVANHSDLEDSDRSPKLGVTSPCDDGVPFPALRPSSSSAEMDIADDLTNDDRSPKFISGVDLRSHLEDDGRPTHDSGHSSISIQPGTWRAESSASKSEPAACIHDSASVGFTEGTDVGREEDHELVGSSRQRPSTRSLQDITNLPPTTPPRRAPPAEVDTFLQSILDGFQKDDEAIDMSTQFFAIRLQTFHVSSSPQQSSNPEVPSRPPRPPSTFAPQLRFRIELVPPDLHAFFPSSSHMPILTPRLRRLRFIVARTSWIGIKALSSEQSCRMLVKPTGVVGPETWLALWWAALGILEAELPGRWSTILPEACLWNWPRICRVVRRSLCSGDVIFQGHIAFHRQCPLLGKRVDLSPTLIVDSLTSSALQRRCPCLAIVEDGSRRRIAGLYEARLVWISQFHALILVQVHVFGKVLGLDQITGRSREAYGSDKDHDNWVHILVQTNTSPSPQPIQFQSKHNDRASQVQVRVKSSSSRTQGFPGHQTII
ncbi:hypothetical protein JAAARDRAFT_709898 [Jaapia argillacea MUCL 33604]|uniref:Uncharacterized protein n=1 Tax=Jaapia argillacea MUCL 33604 TaxID=933084 RepID=A0A067QEY1_9AGAM|nr:hypothetical protein JAAARDRAFT_709898 [Jaapia argillacea MUCL 33604]